MRKGLMIIMLAAATMLSACESDNWGTDQTAGTLLGAGGGALLGNQFGGGAGKVIATAAGAVLGGYLGNQIGASLDKADRAEADQASEKAETAPIGQSVKWNNPDNGHSGTVTPVKDGRDSDGDYCREFQENVTIDGKNQSAYGTACQQPDGSWKIVKQN